MFNINILAWYITKCHDNVERGKTSSCDNKLLSQCFSYISLSRILSYDIIMMWTD